MKRLNMFLMSMTLLVSVATAYVPDLNLWDAFQYLKSGGELYIQYENNEDTNNIHWDTASVVSINLGDSTINVNWNDGGWKTTSKVYSIINGVDMYWNKNQSYNSIKQTSSTLYSTSLEGEYKTFQTTDWDMPDSISMYDALLYTGGYWSDELSQWRHNYKNTYLYFKHGDTINLGDDMYLGTTYHMNNPIIQNYEFLGRPTPHSISTIDGVSMSPNGPFNLFKAAKERIHVSPNQLNALNDSLINNTTSVECREKAYGNAGYVYNVLQFNTITNEYNRYLALRDCFQMLMQYPGYSSRWKRVCDFEFRVNGGDWFDIEVDIRKESTVHDTISVTDTIVDTIVNNIHDTVTVTDTIINTVVETVTTIDTIIIHDTVAPVDSSIWSSPDINYFNNHIPYTLVDDPIPLMDTFTITLKYEGSNTGLLYVVNSDDQVVASGDNPYIPLCHTSLFDICYNTYSGGSNVAITIYPSTSTYKSYTIPIPAFPSDTGVLDIKLNYINGGTSHIYINNVEYSINDDQWSTGGPINVSQHTAVGYSVTYKQNGSNSTYTAPTWSKFSNVKLYKGILSNTAKWTFFDDFEGDSLSSVYVKDNMNGTFVTSTNAVKSGTKGLHMKAGTAGVQGPKYQFPSPMDSGTISFWTYDEAAHNAFDYDNYYLISSDGSNNNVCMSMVDRGWGQSSQASSYAYNLSSSTQNIGNTIVGTRSVGWHEVVFEKTSDSLSLIVDGTELATVSFPLPISSFWFANSSIYPSSNDYGQYIDSLYIECK